MEDKEEYNLSFDEHIKHNRGKYVIVVTKSQYAIRRDEERRIATHNDLIHTLITKTRPDLEVDYWGNALNSNERYTDSNIIIYGKPHYFQMELPKKELLSPKQFEELEKMLNTLKNENKKIDEKGYGTKYEVKVFGSDLINIDSKKDYDDEIDTLIDNLKGYVKEPKDIKEEVIIGKPLVPLEKSKKETGEILAGEMVTSWVNNNLDWDNDFPVYTEDEHKKLGYSAIMLLTLITGIISIVILVLAVVINTL